MSNDDEYKKLFDSGLITRKWLARQLGVTDSAVVHWEKTGFPAERAAEIQKVLAEYSQEILEFRFSKDMIKKS